MAQEGFVKKAGEIVRNIGEKMVGSTQSDLILTPRHPAQPTDRAVRDWIKTELGHLIRDVLSPYKIDDASFSGSAVFPFEHRQLHLNGQNIADILLDYFIADSTTYSKIAINNIFIVVPTPPNDRNEVKINLVNGQQAVFAVNKAVIVKGFGSSAIFSSLKTIFSLLSQLYISLNNAAAYGSKTVISFEGLSNLMNSAATTNDAQILDSIKAEINKQAQSIVNDPIALLDSKTTISNFNIDLAPATALIDILYNEMARVLKIPRTKLFGTAPQGMNATGKYDDKSYNDLLSSLRNYVVNPVLTGLGYSYKTENLVDVDYLTKSIQALQLLETLADDFNISERLAIKNSLFRGQIDGL